MASEPALHPSRFVRSVEATRATLGKPELKLVDLVLHLQELTNQAPYAIIGGLSQILWARKSHTDDLEVLLPSDTLAEAAERVRAGAADRAWQLPSPPDILHEADDVFEVWHLLFSGTVVDLLAFRDTSFNSRIIETAVEVR